MDNDKKMTSLISETENLVKALATLKQEVESYEVAKNNLVEVKTKLVDVNDSTLELTKSISQYTKDLHALVNSDLIRKVDKIIEQNNEDISYARKSFSLANILIAFSILLGIISISIHFIN